MTTINSIHFGAGRFGTRKPGISRSGGNISDRLAAGRQAELRQQLESIQAESDADVRNFKASFDKEKASLKKALAAHGAKLPNNDKFNLLEILQALQSITEDTPAGPRSGAGGRCKNALHRTFSTDEASLNTAIAKLTELGLVIDTQRPRRGGDLCITEKGDLALAEIQIKKK